MARTDNPNLKETDARAQVLLHKDGFSIQDYRRIARLGEGTFGEVWKAERGGFLVALKILKASMSSDETQRELKSLETLRQLHHQNLLHTENFWSDGERLYIEMELADGGTLKERLKAYQAAGQPGIPAEELLKFFTEAAKGLDYLHGNRPVFLHRDIKPANILLVQGAAKLADFGLLRQVTGDNTSTKTQGGTPVYMAPESIKEDRFSVATDLFSFAITYAELRQGKLPFYAKTQFHIYQKICQDPPELTDIFHPEEKKVILKALEKDPAHRYASCGEFVFELNRVVPWVAASVIPDIAPPGAEPGSEAAKSAAKTSDYPAPGAGEFGTSRKRPPTTMPEFGPLPATAAPGTAKNEDGTVVTERRSQPAKPAAPGKKETAPEPTLAAPAAPPTLDPILEKQTRIIAETHAKIRKRSLRRVFATALFVALVSGVGFVGFLALRPDPGPGPGPGPEPPNRDGNGPKPALSPEAIATKVHQALSDNDFDGARNLVARHQADLPDRGADLLSRIENKSKAVALLDRAEASLNKKDFAVCLDTLAKLKAAFDFPADLDRKTRIYEKARDQAHLGLVNEVRRQYQAKKLQPTRDALTALNEFRAKHQGPDWQPVFEIVPITEDLLTQAWKPFLDRKTVIADCRKALKKLQDVAGAPNANVLVLDPLFEQHVAALDAMVQAHEAGGKAVAAAIDVLRAHQPPSDLNRNLWLALARLKAASFRFENLDALPPPPKDELAKDAGSRIFAQTLEEYIKADNHQWLPDDAQRDKCVVWIDQRIADPSDWLLALKAECLVRDPKANLKSINQVKFPLQADWYGSYVHALVTHTNAAATKDRKTHEEAAEILVALLMKKPKVVLAPAERVKRTREILYAAVGALKKPKSREFASPGDAAKAFRWLNVMLKLEGTQGKFYEPWIDLAFAAVQSDDAGAGAVLKDVAAFLDKLPQAEKSRAYHELAKAYELDLNAAHAKLPLASAKNITWDSAILKSKRSQDFAYELRQFEPVETAADLNKQAVELEARAAFAKAERKADSDYDVFEAALQKAKNLKPKEHAESFSLAVLVAKLLAVKDFSRGSIRKSIDEARTELKLPTPEKEWWQARRSQALVGFADAHFTLFEKLILAKEKFDPDPAKEIAAIKESLDSYLEAKTSGKYEERYLGELSTKIGRPYFFLKNYAKARESFSDAKKQLARIQPPYPPALEAEINLSLQMVDYFLEQLKSK